MHNVAGPPPVSRFLFPRWTNLVLPLILIVGATAPIYMAFVVAYGLSPKTLDVGYQPTQPVPYSHALHVGELGLDCRYCHNTVESSPQASVPPTQTCMNCHTQIRKESLKLEPVRASYESGMPIEWTRVNKVGDYAYFDHSAHVNRGVSCVECHGRVDQMEVVQRAAPLSMGWCLECHRDPIDRIRPVSEVFNLGWDAAASLTDADRDALVRQYHLNPSENCSTCHR